MLLQLENTRILVAFGDLLVFRDLAALTGTSSRDIFDDDFKRLLYPMVPT